MTLTISSDRPFPKKLACGSCGKFLDGGVAWSAEHTAGTSETTMGFLLVYHCTGCNALQAKINFMRQEADRLENGEYFDHPSEEWKFVNGELD